MAVQTAKAFRTALRKEPLQNFYYLYGADLVQVAELTDQLVQVATNQQPESALTKLDGKKLDLRELEDAAQMFSLFAPYNCILIHDLNAESLREPAFQQLMDLLKTISGVTVLIFQITGFDVKDGRRSVSGKNKKLIDWIAKHGTVCEAVPASLSELVRQLCSQAKQAGCTLAESDAEEIVSRCNGDTLLLRSELEKLCACADGGTITQRNDSRPSITDCFRHNFLPRRSSRSAACNRCHAGTRTAVHHAGGTSGSAGGSQLRFLGFVSGSCCRSQSHPTGRHEAGFRLPL